MHADRDRDGESKVGGSEACRAVVVTGNGFINSHDFGPKMA